MKDLSVVAGRLYWQIPMDIRPEDCLPGLKAAMPYLSNIHVFYYKNGKQALLRDGVSLWKRIFDIVKGTQRNHYCLLEFVKDESLQAFESDVETLIQLCDEVNQI